MCGGAPNFLPKVLGGGTNGIIHGDLGFQITTGRPVNEVIAERIPATFILAGTALVLWVGIAILLGVYAAIHRYSLFDQLVTFFSYVFYSLPTFWLGLNLIFIFGVALHWFPTGGIITTRQWPPFGTSQYWTAFGHDTIGAIADIGRHLVLPVATLVAVNIAGDSRFVRSSMLESLSQDYVRTAKIKKGAPFSGCGHRQATPSWRDAAGRDQSPLEIPSCSRAIVTGAVFTLAEMEPPVHPGRSSQRGYFVIMVLLLVASIITLFANLLADCDLYPPE